MAKCWRGLAKSAILMAKLNLIMIGSPHSLLTQFRPSITRALSTRFRPGDHLVVDMKNSMVRMLHQVLKVVANLIGAMERFSGSGDDRREI